MPDELLGKIAVKMGIITPKQLEEASQAQKRLAINKSLGRILLEKQFVTEHQLRVLMSKAQKLFSRSAAKSAVSQRQANSNPVSLALADEEPIDSPPPQKRTPKDPLKVMGTTFASKYEIIDFLGAGGMGAVYLGRHNLLKKEYAIKILSKNANLSETALQRFINEARAAASVDHPNVVRVHDVDETEDYFYIIMEYVKGESLHEYVKLNGPLKSEKAIRAIQSAALGLIAIHNAGLIHRDIKPANLLFAHTGEIKITDFGIVKDLDESSTDITGEANIIGTPEFMAPELITKEPVDSRSDVYSLGSTLYYLLTGKPCFTGSTMQIIHQILYVAPTPPHKINPEIDPVLSIAIVKMMAKDPQQRYSNIKQVCKALGIIEVEDAPSKDVAVKSSRKVASKKTVKKHHSSKKVPAPKSTKTAPQQEESGSEKEMGQVLKFLFRLHDAFSQKELQGAAKGLNFKTPSETTDMMCGRNICGYQFVKRLGAGNMGVVYRGTQIQFKRTVAVKLLFVQHSENKKLMANMHAISNIKHCNLLRIYEMGTIENRFFFSMELIRGNNIGEILEQMASIPVANALEIITDAARALTELHKNQLLHRNIKPGKIMLTADGISKLTDSSLIPKFEYTAEDIPEILGDAYYLAPEAIHHSASVDHRSDIYSLGATFYHMLTGIVPHHHPDVQLTFESISKKRLTAPAKINNAIPSALNRCIEKMLEKRPGNRFQTPDDLLNALLAISGNKLETNVVNSSLNTEATGQESEKILRTAKPKAPSKPQPPPPATSSKMWIVGIGVLLLIVISYSLFSGKKKEPQRIKKQPTAQEIRAKKYLQLLESIQTSLQNENPKKWQAILVQAQSFCKIHSGTQEAIEIYPYTKQLRQKIAFAKAQKRFKSIQQEIKELLKRKQFSTAQKRYLAVADFDFKQIQGQMQKLAQKITETALQHREKIVATSNELKKQGHLKQAIHVLDQAKKSQLAANTELFAQQIQAIKDLQQQIVTKQQVIEIAEKLYPLLAKREFTKAKSYLGQKLINTDLQQIFFKEIEILEQLDKQLLQILGSKLKKRDLRFTFLNEKPFSGRVVMISQKRRNVILKTKKGVVSRPIDRLTWTTKKKIWKMGADREIEYKWVLVPIVRGNIPLVQKEIQKFSDPDRIHELQEKLAELFCVYIKSYTRKNKISEIEKLLKQQSVYKTSETWHLMRSALAEFLYKAGNYHNKRRDKKGAQLYYRLIVEYFSNTPIYKLAHKKIQQN